jgi:DNA end-binding protein Ku
MMGITLRYPYEVRQVEDYFDVIEDEKVPKDMLDLAVHIVATKKGKFEPEKFQDEYEDALKELLRKKQKGERIERPKEPSRTNVVNLMDALKRSVAAEKTTAPKAKAKKRIKGQTEMLLSITGKKGKEAVANPVAKPTGRQKKAG